MRRISLWFLSTVSVVMLLFGYHTSTSGPATAGDTVVAAPSGSSTAAGTATTAAGASTVAGSVAQTRWGPVQVRITMTNGKITNVDVLQYPNGNNRDQEINSYALPTLVQETLTAQSANIDMVSGATVTSDGYVQSLQSALDQAGIK
jgi:uncharacterized protein with FMN-binding domain